MPTNEIDSYIEASKSASSRSRFVVLVLVTGSIISFAAAWNSRHDGWMNQRLQLAKIAVLFCEHPKLNEPDWGDSATIEKLATRLEELRISKKPKSHDAAEKQRDQAKDFYKPRFRSCADLNDGLQELDKVNVENSDLIHVPFFGLSFDINDLGMLSGITFVIVLIWLRLSLESELRSVRIIF